MNIKKSVLGLSVGALLGFGGVAQSDELIIDLFDTNQGDTIALLPNLYVDGFADGTSEGGSISTAGTDILGLERDIYVELVSGTGLASAGVSEGKFNFGVNPGGFGTASVQWDGADDSETLNYGLGDIDLSGFDNFEVITESSDLGFEFMVGIYTSADVFTELTLLSHKVDPGSPALSHLQLFTFSLNAFQFITDGDGDTCNTGDGFDFPFANPNVLNMSCGSAGVADLTKVNAIQLIIDPNAKGVGGNGAIDLQLNSIKAVPEPTSLTLLGLGLLGAGAVRRKAKKINA